MLLSRLFISLAVVFFCVSCGFKPLYKKSSISSSHMNASLEEVLIEKESDSEVNNLFKNELYNIFHTQKNYQYILSFSVTKSTAASSIQNNATIGRYVLNMGLHYSLVRKSDGKEIYSGDLAMKGSYDNVISQYSTYIAEEYACKNLMRELARQLHIRVAALLDKEKNENKSK